MKIFFLILGWLILELLLLAITGFGLVFCAPLLTIIGLGGLVLVNWWTFRTGPAPDNSQPDLPRPGWQRHTPRFCLGALCVLCGLLSGCANYTSYIQLPDGGKLALPKDASGHLLVLNREWTDAIGRTNRITLMLSNYNFSMNPAVIDAKTAHDVAIFNAGANLAGTIGGAVVK